MSGRSERQLEERFPLAKPVLQAAREELIKLLAQRALDFRSVTLASGKTSDYYLDCKTVTLHPRGLYLSSLLLFDLLVKGEMPAGVGGPTLGADPLTAGVIVQSERAATPLAGFIIRKEAKGHGTQRWLEGCNDLPAGSSVVLLEDVVTSAGSSLKAIDKIKDAGYKVSRVLCIIDREEGGKEALATGGYRLESLFTGSEVKAVR